MTSEHHHYSDEEKEWLISQDPNLTYRELTNLFNEKFNAHVSRDCISDLMCKRLKKISRRANSERCRFNVGPKKKHSIGDEIIKAGYVWVKVSDEYFPTRKQSFESYKRNWKKKAEIVWEAKYGPIPDDKFLIFLDGNSMNCDIDNLYPITRAVHATMSSNSWYKLNKDFTLAAIKYCELLQAKKGL